MIRYALTTFAGTVEVLLDIDDPEGYGVLAFEGPEAALPHVRRDVTSSFGNRGRTLEGPVCAADLRVAMAGPSLRPYAPKLLD
ncbi:MAG: hypothetical protein ACAI38_10460 [Myxococcota bacterium]|nr:hypothetical protein [Myxococcota bacterium]